MKKVAIVQPRLLHYRVDLFEHLTRILNKEDIELDLIHGGASVREKSRNDEGNIPWALKIKNRFFAIKGVDVVWQRLPKSVYDADLLVLMQENRIISNYPQIIWRKMVGKKIAYWGHGKNLQSTRPNGLREKWKKLWLCSVDWWFGYTRSTSEYLLEQGFSENRITCLNNAINTNIFKKQLGLVTEEDLSNLKQDLGIQKNTMVGLYCGSLYPEKRLDLMIEAADIIHSSVETFYLVIVGDGPSASTLHKASESRSWLKLVGVQKGLDKARYFKLAKVILNPGLVGLHVLDAFCVGLPMVTTNNALHSPEIDYLEDGKNGLILSDSPEVYANGIIELLSNTENCTAMSEYALTCSNKYTIEAMAENFAVGIKACLKDR